MIAGRQPKHEAPAMGKFERACKEVDARFDQVIGECAAEEPEAIMLIRGAAKMILTTYPEHRLRTLAVNNLLNSAEHLTAIETVHD